MISIQLAEKLNKIIAIESGGSSGVRDYALLSSALHRPFQTFNNESLYATAPEKAAAIMESIIINHPFVDGNKRMGYAFMRLILAEEGEDIDTNEDAIYDFVIAVSEGSIRYEGILQWINKNLKK
ncbi:hypothetical protein SCB49_04165 [unidentified eubacterium SCB49]|nr:hypothetical protein SCB49_04165 [unidentified eubacterium SCB49]